MKMNTDGNNDNTNGNNNKNMNKNHRPFASYQKRRSTSITVLSSDDEHDENDVGGRGRSGGGGSGGSSNSWSINDLSASFFYEGRPTPHDFDVEWVLDNDTASHTHEKKTKNNKKSNKSRRNNKNYHDHHDDDDHLGLPYNCSSTSSDDDISDENDERQINNVVFGHDDDDDGGDYDYDYDYDYENIKRKVYQNMNRRRTIRCIGQRRRLVLLLKIMVVCIGIAVVAVPLGLVCTRDKRRNTDATTSKGTSPDAATATATTTVDNIGSVVDVDEDITSLSGDFMDENEETDDDEEEKEEDGGIDEGEDVVVDTSDLQQEDNVDDSTANTNTATTSLTASPTNAIPVTPVPASPPSSPSSPPTLPSPNPSQSGSKSVVVRSNQFLERGEFYSSPSGRYKVGLTSDDGQLVLIKVGDRNGGADETTTVVWSSGVSGGVKCFVQADGNVIVRDSNQNAKWSTETHGNPGAELVVTDQGQIALVDQSTDTAIWLQGVPRTTYQGPSSDDMTFPIRGAFYYPWYPQTWFIGGNRAHYISSMGMYSSSDKDVAKFHVEAMDYSRIDLSIASWWGPSTHLDRARITMLMDETLRQQSPLKWTVYHEVERDRNQTVEELKRDLDYLKRWYAWHPAWAHKDGLPIIFVYNERGCDVARRWKEASQGEWYVVLKIFPKATECEFQPNSWHQYGVGKAPTPGTIHNPGHSYVLSPGFWRADKDVPMVPRVDAPTFCENTKRMVQSNEPWQLIVSFSEAGEGTMIEPSPDWESPSGYGSYLDCLHNNF